jgi:hypothetical protein
MTRDLDYDWVAPPRRAAPSHSARLDSPKHGSFRSPSIGPVRWRITRRPREPTSTARTRHGYGYRCWRAGVSVDRRGRTGNEHHVYGLDDHLERPPEERAYARSLRCEQPDARYRSALQRKFGLLSSLPVCAMGGGDCGLGWWQVPSLSSRSHDARLRARGRFIDPEAPARAGCGD